jgi:excisionase family DNA binding protein
MPTSLAAVATSPDCTLDVLDQLARCERRLTTKDLAKILAISPKTIYRYVERNLIPHYKIEASVRFRAKDVVQWLGGHACSRLEASPPVVRAVAGNRPRKSLWNRAPGFNDMRWHACSAAASCGVLPAWRNLARAGPQGAVELTCLALLALRNFGPPIYAIQRAEARPIRLLSRNIFRVSAKSAGVWDTSRVWISNQWSICPRPCRFDLAALIEQRHDCLAFHGVPHRVVGLYQIAELRKRTLFLLGDCVPVKATKQAFGRTSRPFLASR